MGYSSSVRRGQRVRNLRTVAQGLIDRQFAFLQASGDGKRTARSLFGMVRRPRRSPPGRLSLAGGRSVRALAHILLYR